MSDPQSEIGLGLKMDASNHFTDLTNLIGSPRNGVNSLHQRIGSDPDGFPQAQHMDMPHSATYSTSSQDTLGKHAPADLTFFTDASSENENRQSTDFQRSMQQHHSQPVPQPQKAEPTLSTLQESSLSQAFVDMSSQPTNAHTAAQAHSATHHYLISPTRCSEAQTTVESPAAPEHDQGSGQMSFDCAHAAPAQPKLEQSPEVGRNQVRSHPLSPPTRSQMLPHADMRAIDSGPRSIGPRHIPSHRASNSLGQVAAFMSSLPPRDMFPHYHASAPVSPSDGTAAGPFPQLFQNPEARHDMGMGLAEHSHVFAQGAAHVAARNPGQLAASSAPSVRSASPSASLASTSMTSISPLGSTRINPDGSFTSQESSFDSMSNAASGSFSRASSASEDVAFYELGPLGLPTSLRMSKQKKKLRNIDRKMICDFSAANPSIKQDAIANEFGIERSTVSKILKHKEKWLAIEPGSEAARIAKHRAVKFPAVEDRLNSWAADLKARGEAIRDSTIRHEALRIARELGLGEDKFKASGGWIEKFRERNQIPKPQGSDTNNSTRSDTAAATRESTPLSSSGGVPLAPKPETPSQAPLAPNAAGEAAGASTQSHGVRRQPARSSKAKGTPQKRARDEQEATQAILGMSPLSQDMARMHFNNGGPSAFMSDPAFFRANFCHGGHPTMSQPISNYAHMYHGHGDVPGPSHPIEEEAESDRKRRRAMEEMQGNQAGLGLGPPIEFQFSQVAGAGAAGAAAGAASSSSTSSHVQLSDQLSQAFGSAVSTPQKGGVRSRRTPAKSTDGSGRGRSRRSKGRLSNANHTPQTPSPLSMSPADNNGGVNFGSFTAADAEQLTAATLERIRVLQNSGDRSSIVTAEQAKESLEVVLRFLREQPSDFLPQDHFVLLGHLQANIEQKIRDQLAGDHAAEASSSQPSLSLQNGEADGENASTAAAEH